MSCKQCLYGDQHGLPKMQCMSPISHHRHLTSVMAADLVLPSHTCMTSRWPLSTILFFNFMSSFHILLLNTINFTRFVLQYCNIIHVIYLLTDYQMLFVAKSLYILLGGQEWFPRISQFIVSKGLIIWHCFMLPHKTTFTHNTLQNHMTSHMNLWPVNTSCDRIYVCHAHFDCVYEH